MNESGRVKHLEGLAQVATLSALALVLSYLETMIPLPFAVPGIKLGLANVVVLVALLTCGIARAGFVMCVKVLASGLLFGSPLMLAYSAGGTLLAFVAMVTCKLIPWMDVVPTSMLAAIFHNLGQLAVASVLLSTPSVFLTFPMLAVAACVTGFLTGLVAAGVINSAPHPTPRPYSFPREALEAHSGLVTAIIGRNGSGKTTLGLQLAGLVPQETAYENESNTKRKARLVKDEKTHFGKKAQVPNRLVEPQDAAHLKVGVCFQNADDQIVCEAVEEDVAFGPENRGVPTEKLRELVSLTLDRMSLTPLRHKRAGQLSGGQRYQVATAGLVALSPDVLFFDESDAMLSPAKRTEFWQDCRRLANEGHAVIVSTHSLDDAFACDRIAIVADGRVKAQGDPTELSRQAPFLDLLEDTGLGLPFSLQLSLELKQRGLDIPLACNESDLESGIVHVVGLQRRCA